MFIGLGQGSIGRQDVDIRAPLGWYHSSLELRSVIQITLDQAGQRSIMPKIVPARQDQSRMCLAVSVYHQNSPRPSTLAASNLKSSS